MMKTLKMFSEQAFIKVVKKRTDFVKLKYLNKNVIFLYHSWSVYADVGPIWGIRVSWERVV